MSQNTDFSDFEDSLLDVLAAETPRTVVLASVHRPTFSQQLTFLHDSRPGLTAALPAASIALAHGRKSAAREISRQ